MMSDEELAKAGERLYASLLETQLSVFEIGGLTAAVRAQTSWFELGPRLKVAVFKIVANSQPPEQFRQETAPPPASPPTTVEAPAPAAGPATTAANDATAAALSSAPDTTTNDNSAADGSGDEVDCA